MQFCGVELICPILVVEGILFEVGQDSKGTIRLEETEHMRYCKSQIWKGTRQYCPIEVVTESFFPKLLELIESDCRQILRLMEARSDDILEAARHQDEYGESRQSALEDFLP